MDFSKLRKIPALVQIFNYLFFKAMRCIFTGHIMWRKDVGDLIQQSKPKSLVWVSPPGMSTAGNGIRFGPTLRG